MHLLDGGIVAWEQAGRDLSDEIVAPARGQFEIDLRPELLAARQYIRENLDNEDVLVLDARSPAEFSGEDVRADRGGHEGAVATLCQAGFRAAHSYVALRIIGYEDARMYDGSWVEWGNDEAAPIADVL